MAYCGRGLVFSVYGEVEGWRLTTVDLLMSLQQVLLDEAHVALTAPKGPLTCAIKSTTTSSPHYFTLYLHPSHRPSPSSVLLRKRQFHRMRPLAHR